MTVFDQKRFKNFKIVNFLYNFVITIFGQNPLQDWIRDSAKYLDPDPFETLDVPFLILIFFSMGPLNKNCVVPVLTTILMS